MTGLADSNQRYRPGTDGICLNCGRTIGWHAGYKCFPPDRPGMPAPVETERQLELEVAT
jgi:hypothetical protein